MAAKLPASMAEVAAEHGQVHLPHGQVSEHSREFSFGFLAPLAPFVIREAESSCPDPPVSNCVERYGTPYNTKALNQRASLVE